MRGLSFLIPDGRVVSLSQKLSQFFPDLFAILVCKHEAPPIGEIRCVVTSAGPLWFHSGARLNGEHRMRQNSLLTEIFKRNTPSILDVLRYQTTGAIAGDAIGIAAWIALLVITGKD